MSIDPITLPDGTVVETSRGRLCFKDGEGLQTFRQLLGEGHPTRWGDRTIARVLVPVPDGMTLADAEAALADAGAWVEVEDFHDIPKGARCRSEWSRFAGKPSRSYVHRDDLPPTDPDAELVEKMARAAWETQEGCDWADVSDGMRRAGLNEARAALAALREHETKS